MYSFKYKPNDEKYLISKGALKTTDRILPDNIFAWVAFMNLRNSRTIGMAGVSPIPFSEIMSYCQHIGADCPIQRHRLVRFVTALDNAERKHHGNSKV